MSPTETETTDAKKQDGVKREISVEIPADEVARETEVIVQKYQKVARSAGLPLRPRARIHHQTAF